MKTMQARSLRFEDGKLSILDQTLLPQTERWIVCDSLAVMVDSIKQLKVRGAPLLGVSAVLFLAYLTEQGRTLLELKQAAKALYDARPTAVNLHYCIDQFLKVLADDDANRALAILTAEAIFTEDVELCERIANHGADLIHDGETIMTHCNTGGLATVGIGTALGVIQKAHEQGKQIHVYVDETRPLLQGGRLTAWECEKSGIPYTLITDNMAAHVMASKKIDRVIVGADRIALNGDFANKIGTYHLSVAANYHDVPFHTAAPYTTVDSDCPNGAAINIEQRLADEVRGFSGQAGNIIWAPANSKTYNPAFDVTPATLVTSYILDKGVLTAAQLQGLFKAASKNEKVI